MTATDEIEILFQAARAARDVPGEDFLARLAAEAEALQPPAPTPVPRRARAGAGLLSWLGGWPALGGLTAATVAGFWLGVAPPAGLTVMAAEIADQTVDFGIYGEDDLFALLEE